MSGLHEYHQIPPWAEQIVGIGDVPDVVIAVPEETHNPDQHELDTSFVVAADDRTSESQELVAAGGGGDKKPPSNFPGGELTFEDPEENNENQPIKAVGEVATKAEVATEAAEQQPVSDNLEVIQHTDGSTTLVNKAHSQPDLLEKVTTRLEGGDPWAKLPLRPETESKRKYYVDNEENPTFFAKVTNPLEEPEGQNELELASHVQAVVSSEQGQRIAQEHGFSRVSYVEPLVLIDKPGEHQTIIYPYQAGERIDISEDPAEMARALELSDMTHELNGLLAANGVNATDIDFYQFIADGNDLHLLDAEHYGRFEQKEPTLAPGETSQFVFGRWEEEVDSTEFYRGEAVVARQAEDGSGVQLSTGVSEEGYAVALWNTHTSEAALLNLRSSTPPDDQIRELVGRVPSLESRGTVAYIVGPEVPFEDPDESQIGTPPPFGARIDTAVHLASHAAQVSKFDPGGPSRVSIDTSTGELEVTSGTGEVKRFSPPRKISQENRP